ncbi:MAG: glycoside hydrolase family 28 protein [Kiritimatiellia bacterium]|jgi:polygalacturonase
MKNVKDFGAVGDGIANDTAAIQRAVDSGGVALLPPGTYRSGTIHLRSHGGLHLECGSTLLASRDRADYNADDYCPQNGVFTQETVTGAHLLSAVGVEDVSLTGGGAIDGDCGFWNRRFSDTTPAYLPEPGRPGQMVFLCECRGLVVDGLQLRNAPYWHLFLHGCENARLSRLRIDGEKRQATNDGIDIDCCRDVVVSGCIIRTGDDAIAVRANGERLTTARPCENIVVTGCILSSYNDNAIRVGVGDGLIRRCLFSNLVIEDTRTAICLVARYGAGSTGVDIEDVSFRHLQVQAHRLANIKLANFDTDPPLATPRHIRRVSLADISADVRCTFNIIGIDGGEIADIRVRDLDMRCGGVGPYPGHVRGEWWGRGSTDCAFRVYKARDVVFDGVRLHWTTDHPGWKHAMSIADSTGVECVACHLPKGIANIDSTMPDKLPRLDG